MDTCSISAICSNVIFMTAYKCSLLYCRSVKTDFSLSSLMISSCFSILSDAGIFLTFQSINHMVIIPAHCFFRLLVICVRPCFPASKLFFAFENRFASEQPRLPHPHKQSHLPVSCYERHRFFLSNIACSFLSCVKMARQKGGGSRRVSDLSFAASKKH